MTNEIRNACIERDRLYRKFKNNRRNQEYEKKFKKFRNELNRRINQTKSRYYKQKFYETKSNPKEAWKLVNTILEKKSSNLDEVISRNFVHIENFEDLANQFSKRISLEVANTVHECNHKTFQGPSNRTQRSIYMEEATVREIENILSSMNEHKSPGIDGIRPKDLKNNAKSLASPITKIINMSLDQSIVPNLLKTSIVRPIHKSDKKSEIGNYRPISILSSIDKVLEEVVSKRLYNYLEKYKLLEKNQFGFRKNKSINRLIGDFTDKLYTSLDKNQNSIVLFIDFQKAFDTLSHKNILRQLEKVGVRRSLLNWFENYLEERKFYWTMLSRSEFNELIIRCRSVSHPTDMVVNLKTNMKTEGTGVNKTV